MFSTPPGPIAGDPAMARRGRRRLRLDAKRGRRDGDPNAANIADLPQRELGPKERSSEQYFFHRRSLSLNVDGDRPVADLVALERADEEAGLLAGGRTGGNRDPQR